MKTKLILWACLAIGLAACGGQEQPTPDTQDTIPVVNPPEEPIIDTLEGAPVELVSDWTHVQPMTGIVLWPGNGKMQTLKNSISLEFHYCLPCRVVTGKKDGAILYDWSYFEDILTDITSRGHQAVIRFRYEYPSSRDVNGEKGTTAVPQYIKDLPDYEETYSANPGGDGPTYYADWSNEELKWFTKQFYTDFAAVYGNDPRIAFLEVGFGHWSEYHIYGTPLKFGKNFPTKEYQKEFFEHLGGCMPLAWLVSIDAGDDTYFGLERYAKELATLPYGLFDDSFMHSGHDKSQGDGWNEQCWRFSDPKGTRWQVGVNGGEVSYYTSADQRNFLNPEGMYGVTWEQAAAKYHMTFIIGNDAPGGQYATPERFTEAALAAGYKFAVLDAREKDGKTSLLVTNEGVAPIYYDAYFAIDGTRSATSLKGLLPGERRVVEIPVTGAKPVIECDHLLPGQEIQYRARTAK